MKSNQGMRQPQMGGIQSQLQLATASPLCARAGHTKRWRLKDGAKWICATCHPPRAPVFELEESA